MMQRARKAITLASIGSMLLMQVPQVFAACVCDMSACDQTCEEPAMEPVIEAPGSCCATPTADAPMACAMTASEGAAAAYTKPCCAKELVISAETSSATVPSGPEMGHARIVLSPVTSPLVPIVAATGAHFDTGALRAPPGSPTPHLYLLTASLII